MSHLFEYFQRLSADTIALKSALDLNQPWAPTVVFALFSAVSTLRILAYAPQIIRAARDRNGASAISYTTWGLFLISNVVTTAYAIVCQGDLIVAIVFMGNAIACAAILGVTYFKRCRHQRRCAGRSITSEPTGSVPGHSAPDLWT